VNPPLIMDFTLWLLFFLTHQLLQVGLIDFQINSTEPKFKNVMFILPSVNFNFLIFTKSCKKQVLYYEIKAIIYYGR